MTDGILWDFPATNEEATMVGKLLIQGLLAGLIAGLISFGFARVVGEPQVDLAIAFEAQQDAAKDANAAEHGHDEELVSRSTQAGLGLMTGVTVYGTSIGGLFALTFAFLYGRVKKADASKLSLALAGAAFVAIVIVPMLKYPANPPSVGQPETIGYRTGLYFLFLVFSIAVMIVSVRARYTWSARLGRWNASLAAAGLYVLLLGIGMTMFPAINEVPATFPAHVLWDFRIASLGLQAVMWTALGIVFGAIVEHRERSTRLSPTRNASA
ncbi:putative cobalt transporter CbtA [Paraburkholderia caribensis MBA4]|uniref:Putative cobalt transporter CbtA n=2 Tax=Paraburkholderia caribensis TaxID=75105 RepID=A0A0P0RIL8_9BURK|nr:putative cobalt transporter CbtA [Paraburkholderia caribensis MBA4]